MLDKDGIRQLAYVVKIDDIKPIPGRDRVECAVVGGWTCMVPKDAFHAGDLGIYFEIDSKVDTSRPEFAFTEKYNGKIKTQKFTLKDESGNKVGTFYSQGLLMAPADFGWTMMPLDRYPDIKCWIASEGKDLHEGNFLTSYFGVTYADAEDNKRKAKSDTNAKYKAMAGRHPKLFKSPVIKALYKTKIGKKVLFLLFGKKTDKKKEWPAWVKKTDEERIQNLVPLIPSYAQEKWIATEKIDGTSTTFSLKKFGKKKEFYVCSRNVVMNLPGKEKTCYYANTDGNVYTEMAEKYDMKRVLECILIENPQYDFVTIQGETYGGSIQKRNYSILNHNLMVFNVIFGDKTGETKRLNPFEMKLLMDKFDVPTVPILGELEIPNTCEEILALAEGPSVLDNLSREGIVFRSLDGAKSFKAVSNSFLAKYHG